MKKQNFSKLIAATVATSAIVVPTAALAADSTTAQNGVYFAAQGKFYKVDQLSTIPFADLATLMADNSKVYIYTAGVGTASLAQITAANGNYITAAAQNGNINNPEKVIPSGVYTDKDGGTITLTGNATTEFKVESVSAINANEVLIKFNKELDKASATLAANYEVELNKITISDANLRFELQEDKKSVLIRYVGTTPTAFTAGDKLVVQVKDGVKDTDGKAVERFTTDTIVFSATAAPKLVGEPVLTSNGLVFQFDRPISESASTLVKVDGVALADTNFAASNKNGVKLTASSVKPSPGSYYYVIDTTTAEYDKAKVAGKHEVVVFDVFETAVNNPEKASVINTSYTVSVDTTAPSVVGITAVNANRFFIEFTEAVTIDTTFANSITVKKGNLQFDTVTTNADISEDTTVQTYVSAPTTRDGKPGVYVSIEEGITGTTNPLYATNESEVTLNVTVEKYKDSSNLLGTKYEGTVKLSKNTASPKVSQSVVNTEDLVLLFDAELAANSTIFGSIQSTSVGGKTVKYFDLDSGSDYDAGEEISNFLVIKDKDGIIVPDDKINSISLGSSYPNSSTTYSNRVVTVDIDSAYEKRAPYTVTFKKNAVKYALNKTIAGYNAEATANKEFNTTVGTAADSASKYYVGVGTPTAQGNVITVPYNADMDASARLVSSYLLDGKALPNGSTVDFYQDKKTVKITLPAGSLNSSTQYKLTISKDVKTAAGQIVVGDLQKLNAFESTITGLVDNTRPTLASAEYYVTSNAATSSQYLLVKFSESVKGSAVIANKDLEVKVNGNQVGVEAILNGSTTATQEDAYVILKLDTAVNLQQAATITVIPKVATDETSVITDLAGNKLAASTVTTTGKTLDAQNNFAALDVAPAAPSVAVAGTINAPTTVEYRLQGTTSWATGTGSAVTVTPGIYEYRTVATSTSNGVASESGYVTVFAVGAVAATPVTAGSATETELNTFFSGLGTQLVGKKLPTVSLSGTTITLDGTSADSLTGVTAFQSPQDSGKYAVYKIAAPSGLNATSAALTSGGTNILDTDKSGVTFVQRLADTTYSTGWTLSGSEYTKTVDIFFKNDAGTEVKVTYTLISKQ